ncbi:hypothetical protein B0H11DRAFT_2027155 [Mycena galericulata]|nr:hypothetical protein B0H11DRAFT_2027155 [Mycena galericulata]
MLETIQMLRGRIEELESLAAPDPTNVYLNQPYISRSHPPDNFDLGGFNLPPGRSTSVDMLEPPHNLVTILVDVFLDRFCNSGYFFLEPLRFRQSALLPLPFGHRDRPSPALLSAVYLWGTVLSPVRPADAYTPDGFLLCVLQNIPHDLNNFGFGGNNTPQLMLETIQAEVLLSFYYLHMAQHVQGRYHASVAASLALTADLHLIRSPHAQQAGSYPTFALGAQSLLPPPVSAADEACRINAFWAVVILNNYWVAASGGQSAIPYGMRIDTPWLASSAQGGATITNFLNGDGTHGNDPTTRLAKASILLERTVAFAARIVGPPDPNAFAALDRRLHTFQGGLPPLPAPSAQTRTPMLVATMTHALVDTAIVRLHAPYARTTDTSRRKCLAAAARIIGLDVLNAANAYGAESMLGPVYTTIASMYMHELEALAQYPVSGSPRAVAQARELETRLGSLMSAMAALSPYSPLIEQCFVAMRATYAGMTRSG